MIERCQGRQGSRRSSLRLSILDDRRRIREDQAGGKKRGLLSGKSNVFTEHFGTKRLQDRQTIRSIRETCRRDSPNQYQMYHVDPCIPGQHRGKVSFITSHQFRRWPERGDHRRPHDAADLPPETTNEFDTANTSLWPGQTGTGIV